MSGDQNKWYHFFGDVIDSLSPWIIIILIILVIFTVFVLRRNEKRGWQLKPYEFFKKETTERDE